MIRSILRLAVVVLIFHALIRLGGAYWKNFVFEDEVTQTVQFGHRATEEELRQQILTVAEAMQVPLHEEALRVERDTRSTAVYAQYRDPVELLPRYRYAWPFEVEITVFSFPH